MVVALKKHSLFKCTVCGIQIVQLHCKCCWEAERVHCLDCDKPPKHSNARDTKGSW